MVFHCENYFDVGVFIYCNKILMLRLKKLSYHYCVHEHVLLKNVNIPNEAYVSI